MGPRRLSLVLTSDLAHERRTTVLIKREGSYWHASIADPHMDIAVQGIEHMTAIVEFWCDKWKMTPEYHDIVAAREQVRAEQEAKKNGTALPEMESEEDEDAGAE